MNNNNASGKLMFINGPVVKAENAEALKMREMVLIGRKKLIGEVVSVENENATLQVYEETSGLEWGEEVVSTGRPLSVKLGPGILSNIFDGIERPLEHIYETGSAFIPEGIGLISINMNKPWDVHITAKVGDYLKAGSVYATVQETSLILHKLMVPPKMQGKVVFAEKDGSYPIDHTVVRLLDEEGEEVSLKLYQEWPVRTPRPVTRKKAIEKPLVTGQRVIDTFFPLAKGGTAAIPGGFGTGKTITQHQLAKWSDADII
ncbi:MAG: H+transporting two-sector ATPase alpha/beta subunit central region, partial [Clostridia bacterium]|nr:H+transporting two-sector ATPase alpha/beta subunit central region [Clostridia bacterium]